MNIPKLTIDDHRKPINEKLTYGMDSDVGNTLSYWEQSLELRQEIANNLVKAHGGHCDASKQPHATNGKRSAAVCKLRASASSKSAIGAAAHARKAGHDVLTDAVESKVITSLLLLKEGE
jgi:hypothetical protein